MIFQTLTLSETVIKSRWREPYVTSGLNQKALAGDVRGVVAGFRVVPSVGYTVVVLPDPVLGYSIANVHDSSGEQYSLTLLVTGSLFVDLTAQANSTVFVVLDAQYSQGSPSTAQLRVVDAAQLLISPDFIPLAKVVVPASPPILTTDINMGYRLSMGDSLTPDAQPPFNLLTNGSFERDTTGTAPIGWDVVSGASLSPVVDGTIARSGTKSLRLSSGGAVTGSFGANPVSFEAGQLARASAWVRSTGGTPIAGGTGVAISVLWLDSTFAAISSVQLEGVFSGGSTTFELRQAEVTAPAGTSFAKLVVSYGACSGTLYVDDAQFLARSGDALARSAVFGGNTTIADRYHAHTAAGLNYAGSAPNNWADGTSIPAGTVEAAIDAIPAAIGSPSGAAKVGFTPVTPVDLTGITRVDNALNTLDDLKAGINIANTFTKTNTFTPSVANTSGIVVNANGTAAGIVANGSIGGSNGLNAFAVGAGVGIYGNSPGGGVKGESTVGAGVTGNGIAGTGPGVLGTSATTGSGVTGLAGTNTADFGTNVLNPAAAGPGNGGTFMGATGDAGGDGIQAWGRGTANSRTGVLGVGAFPTLSGTAGGTGGYFFGGTAGGGNAAGGSGVIGVSGAKTGTGLPGHGVFGNGNGLAGAIGVRGVAGTFGGIGVKGETGGSFTVGVQGVAASNNTVGVQGLGTVGINTTGVSGVGGGTAAGGSFTGGEAGGIGLVANGTENLFGIWATGGGTGPGSGIGVFAQGGAPNGIGLRGTAAGTGTGVVGRSSTAATTPPSSVGVFGEGSQGVYGLSNSVGGASIGVLGIGVGGSIPANDGGVVGKGGSAGGPAVIAIVHGQSITAANTVGTGVYAIGGSNAGVVGLGAGVSASANFAANVGVAGIGNPGGYFSASSGNKLAILSGGFIDFFGSTDPGQKVNPLASEAEFNRLSGKNVTKAWAQIIFDSQTPSAGRIIDGFNASSVTRSGTTYFLNYVTSVGRPDMSGTGDSFTLSGITITFLDAAATFAPGDVGRTIVIAGATTANNNGSYVITAYVSPTQVQYLNALGVTEAFPGTWSISETPYAVALTMSDRAVASAMLCRFNETSSTRVGFVFRDSAGTAVNAGANLDTVRVTITVTGPQY